MYKEIHNFSEIGISSKCTLVLDFDETIAKYASITKKWKEERFNYHYSIHGSFDIADKLVFEDWKYQMHISKPEHTDKIGLFNLIATANKHKCRILCLTARSPELKEITIKHMKYLDVPIDEIYFCEKIGKGHYLNSIIDDGDDIIFVDDLDKNLLNVLDNVKFAKSLSCFKFIIS